MKILVTVLAEVESKRVSQCSQLKDYLNDDRELQIAIDNKISKFK